MAAHLSVASDAPRPPVFSSPTRGQLLDSGTHWVEVRDEAHMLPLIDLVSFTVRNCSTCGYWECCMWHTSVDLAHCWNLSNGWSAFKFHLHCKKKISQREKNIQLTTLNKNLNQIWVARSQPFCRHYTVGMTNLKNLQLWLSCMVLLPRSNHMQG